MDGAGIMVASGDVRLPACLTATTYTSACATDSSVETTTGDSTSHGLTASKDSNLPTATLAADAVPHHQIPISALAAPIPNLPALCSVLRQAQGATRAVYSADSARTTPTAMKPAATLVPARVPPVPPCATSEVHLPSRGLAHLPTRSCRAAVLVPHRSEEVEATAVPPVPHPLSEAARQARAHLQWAAVHQANVQAVLTSAVADRWPMVNSYS